MRSGLLVVAVAFVALVWAAAPALAEPPEIGPPVAELTTLVHDGTALLNAHLSPGLDQEVTIGWQTNAGPGDTSPATTNAVTRTITSNLTGKTRIEHLCQIAVDEPIFDADTAADSNWAKEIITHELFHCYENQIEGDAANAITGSQAFLQEGMARWVDVDLFSSDPIGISVGSIEKYFASSTVPLFARSYDAVGFWGHLQDVEGDLWSRIPSILRAAAGGRQATVDAALSSVNEEKFFDTWGSSAVNRPEGGSAWTAHSPDPSAGFAATIHTITPAGPDSPVSTSLDAYSTNQLMISMPAAPPGDIETMHIDLGGAYGRFGVVDNYTGPELKTLTFCGGPSGCTATPTPPAGGCGGGETFVPPPPLTPLPSDALLGIAAGKTSATVTIEYTAISTEAATTGTCETPPQPGSDTGTAASGGDPHLIDFDGYLFNFQAAGEFTLLKSTRDNLEIQVRQQPFPHSRTVAVNTAVAMRVGRSVVEIDSASQLGVSALVDHHRLHGTHAALPGGGSVALVHVGFPLPPGTTVASLCSRFVPGGGAAAAFCEKFIGSLVKGSTTATVRWSDGTTVSVTNSLTGTSETHWAPSLGLQIKVARKRLRHLTGLIGNADVPSDQEFHGRNGTSYDATDILDGDVGTAAQAKVLYGEFGASWRITQRESLFTYARGKSTRSYTITNFPDEGFNPSTAPPSKKQQAGALCEAAGAKAAAVLNDCEYDVLATGDPAFAGGSVPLQKVAKTYPATSTTTTTPTTPPVLHPIDLGTGENAPEAAYDPASGDTYVVWVDNSGSSIDVCTVTPAAPSCNGGAGPDQLVDPLSAGVGEFFNTQVVVGPGGDVVVLGELLGASSATTPPGYGGGVVAWVSPAGGAAFGAAGQGVADGGKLLANVEGAGDAPSAGALALDATHIGVYGDHAPFGNGFTDFALTAPAPATTPTVDSTGEFGDQLGIDGNQVASIPDPAAPGEYIVVAVGGDGGQPAACPAGTQGATGYGVGIGTPATLATQAAWSSQYFFTPESCQAEAPVLAGGGPDGGSIGLLEDEGPGLFGSGSDGIFYHQFEPATDTFGPALPVSDETSQTLDGPDGLDVSSDSSGGVYASWSDDRGDELDYSSDGGASWPPTPATVDLPTGAGDVIVSGAGQGNAELAYTLNPGSGTQEYVVPVNYSEFAGG